MFKFSPKSDEDLEKSGLLDDGIYDFEVIFFEERMSKKGNPMVEIKLKIWGKDGIEKIISDFLIDIPGMAFKIKKFLYSIGLYKDYKLGYMTAENCLSKTGKADITAQKGKQKENSNEFYPDRNVVKNYIETESNSYFDDDISF